MTTDWRETVAESDGDSGKAEQYTGPLIAGQLFTFYEQVNANCSEHGREINEHHHARCAGIREAGVYEEELASVERTCDQPGPPGAVAIEQRYAAPSCPAEQ